MNQSPTSAIVGIQFGLTSPESIRNNSVVEIKTKDLYNSNNSPAIGGPMDPRMGVLEAGKLCPTDGLDQIHSPGYFGHLELAKPVFHMHLFNDILKWCRCVCFRCSKLLISKQTHRHITEWSAYERWQYVSEISKTVRRCGSLTDDGCNAEQPSSIKKVGIATIMAEWTASSASKKKSGNDASSSSDKNVTFEYTPEFVIALFSRISNEDVLFAGFNPYFARPEWMICQVLAIPPPAVRPSVRMDSQQRAEDDLTLILIQIMKANKLLLDKLKSANAVISAGGVVTDQTNLAITNATLVLQYVVSSLVSNKIPGTSPLANRNNKPLKPIMERLNGKTGRMRQNLQAKRVNYGGRSVITADPNISILGLGVPLKIAMMVTVPVVVNNRNREFLTQLVKNGPDVWPGAKDIQRISKLNGVLGDLIGLKYYDRSLLRLSNGDVVHRHLMDDDYVLFNRQPTLHRPSIQAHQVKVIRSPDIQTFRFNVSVTAPYNADFDGDEMNMHVPQNSEAMTELRCLCAVEYQVISPSKNSPIIGVFQDSLLGAYLFSRPDVKLSLLHTMGLLVKQKRFNLEKFVELVYSEKANDALSSYDVLSMIMPPLTMRIKNRHYDVDASTKEKEKEKETKDHDNDTRNRIEIIGGNYVHGQMEKSALGSGGKGILHRVCNDFGNRAVANFIDDLQNVVTTYMKMEGFSVGISDLITSGETKRKVGTVLQNGFTDVNSVLTQLQLGVFQKENTTGRSNRDEAEMKIINILNKTSNDAGRTALQSLDPNTNRFIKMFRAGSKGSELNIQQMTACLGQQCMQGNKRIPYSGFTNRTLPHFTQFDDSACARGYIPQSYIDGLTPQALYFHAMAGRVGLIDTAVKTSVTGYIQHRFIKMLEDLTVYYDHSVRNSKNRIVQFRYAGDGFDPIRIEMHEFPLLRLPTDAIYAHFLFMEEDVTLLNSITVNGGDGTSAGGRYTRRDILEFNDEIVKIVNRLLKWKGELLTNVYRSEQTSVSSSFSVRSPVAFQSIINNITTQCNVQKNSLTDITEGVIYILRRLHAFLERLERVTHVDMESNIIFLALFWYHLSPKMLLLEYRCNHATLNFILNTVELMYKRAMINPGEMCGILAAQSLGEPATQMTLNTFHYTGIASKSNVTRGVPRLEELLSLSPRIKNPSLTVFLKQDDQTSRERASAIQHMMALTTLRDITAFSEIRFDPTPDDVLGMSLSMKGDDSKGDDSVWLQQYKLFELAMQQDEQESMGYGMLTPVKSKWVLRLEMDREAMFEKNITMDDVHFAIKQSFRNISCVYSDYNFDQLVFRIRLSDLNTSAAEYKSSVFMQNVDNVYYFKTLQNEILDKLILRGINNITQVNLRQIKNTLVPKPLAYEQLDIWVLDTVGSNLLQVLGLDYIDKFRTISNDVNEVFSVLGIEAARQTLINEIVEIFEFDGASIDYRHVYLFVDRVTYNEYLIKADRHGLNGDDVGVLAKASFEMTSDMFMRGAKHAEFDSMTGLSANIMFGQTGKFGTGAFNVLVDTETLTKQQNQQHADAEEDEEYEGDAINDNDKDDEEEDEDKDNNDEKDEDKGNDVVYMDDDDVEEYIEDELDDGDGDGGNEMDVDPENQQRCQAALHIVNTIKHTKRVKFGKVGAIQF